MILYSKFNSKTVSHIRSQFSNTFKSTTLLAPLVLACLLLQCKNSPTAKKQETEQSNTSSRVPIKVRSGKKLRKEIDALKSQVASLTSLLKNPEELDKKTKAAESQLERQKNDLSDLKTQLKSLESTYKAYQALDDPQQLQVRLDQACERNKELKKELDRRMAKVSESFGKLKTKIVAEKKRLEAMIKLIKVLRQTAYSEA